MAGRPPRSRLPRGRYHRSRDFWSLTLYNAQHFFHPNALNWYSLGTKNKTLKYYPDGSLTLYAGAAWGFPRADGWWLVCRSAGRHSDKGRRRALCKIEIHEIIALREIPDWHVGGKYRAALRDRAPA